MQLKDFEGLKYFVFVLKNLDFISCLSQEALQRLTAAIRRLLSNIFTSRTNVVRVCNVVNSTQKFEIFYYLKQYKHNVTALLTLQCWFEVLARKTCSLHISLGWNWKSYLTHAMSKSRLYLNEH